MVDAVSGYAVSAYVNRDGPSGGDADRAVSAGSFAETERECRASFKLTDEVAGDPPARWFSHVRPGNHELPEKPCKRADLFEFISTEPSIELVAAAIFAWGGMQRHHARRLFEKHAWLGAAKAVREGRYSRAEAYEMFANLRRQNELPGMGPAYFTKLIFFLMPRSNAAPVGYIMDQWTACSINVLLDQPDAVLTDATYTWAGPGKLASQFVVSDLNSGVHYEAFCQAVEAIAVALDLAPDATELLLLSEGGRNPYPWREYVKQHRRPALNGLAA